MDYFNNLHLINECYEKSPNNDEKPDEPLVTHALYAFFNEDRFPPKMLEEGDYMLNFQTRGHPLIDPNGSITGISYVPDQNIGGIDTTRFAEEYLHVDNPKRKTEILLPESDSITLPNGRFDFNTVLNLLAERFGGTRSVLVAEPPIDDPAEVFHPSLEANRKFNSKDYIYQKGNVPDQLLSQRAVSLSTDQVRNINSLVTSESTESVEMFEQVLSFPLRVKPHIGGSGKGQRVANSPAELKEVVTNADYVNGLIIEPQRNIDAEVAFRGINTIDDYVSQMHPQLQLVDRDGDFCGSLRYSEKLVDPQIRSVIDNARADIDELLLLLKSQGSVGPVSIDTIIDDLSVVVTDINNRLGGGSILDNLVVDESDERIYLSGGISLSGKIDEIREQLIRLKTIVPEVHFVGYGETKNYSASSIIVQAQDEKHLESINQRIEQHQLPPVKTIPMALRFIEQQKKKLLNV
jgi:hypothetical protein